MSIHNRVADNINAKFDIRKENYVPKFPDTICKVYPEKVKVPRTPFIKQFLRRFHMGNFKDVSTLITLGTVMEKADPDETLLDDGNQCQEPVGSLPYLANTVRPNNPFAVGIFSRYMEQPTKAH